jgi:hypothetical protein
MRPITVPVGIELIFIADPAVGDAVGKGNHEMVTTTPITIEIDIQIHAIDVAVVVALGPLPGARYASRLQVEERDRQTIGGRDVPRLGRVPARLAGERLGHAEIANPLHAGPCCRINLSIDINGERRQRQRGDQR